MSQSLFDTPTLFDAGEETAGIGAPEDTVTARLLVAYHGAAFHGFAINVGVPTVGAAIRDAAERFLGHEVHLAVAGRTDKGVHAWGNVVSFKANASRYDPTAFQAALNKMLSPHIVVRQASVARPGFNARFSARSRSYRYLIHNAALPSPFLVDRAWHIEKPLKLALLQMAGDPLLGEHDFTSFCRKPKPVEGKTPSLVRRITSLQWDQPEADLLRLTIVASGFCHQMVRSIVGLLAECGLGAKHPGEVLSILRARDRSAASQLAPPQGLTLWHVDYEGE